MILQIRNSLLLTRSCVNVIGMVDIFILILQMQKQPRILLKTICALLSYIWKQNKPIDPTEKAILRKSVIAFYEYVNNSSVDGTNERIFPNLIEYRNFLRDVFIYKMTDFEKRRFEIEEVLLLLEPYTDGELSFC